MKFPFLMFDPIKIIFSPNLVMSFLTFKCPFNEHPIDKNDAFNFIDRSRYKNTKESASMFQCIRFRFVGWFSAIFLFSPEQKCQFKNLEKEAVCRF